jgi:hypothetical protein
MSKERKKFKDTKLGQFLKDKVPGVLDVVDDFFPPAKILTALVGKESLPPEDSIEFERLLRDHEREMYTLEVEDRDSARNREIEMAKTGKQDHLMYAAGYTALGTFLLMVYAVIWKPEGMEHSPLFHQLMGIIEGVALTVFGYYFGTSKRAEEKKRPA